MNPDTSGVGIPDFRNIIYFALDKYPKRVYIKIIRIPHAGILDVWVIFYLSSLNFKIQGELLMENKNVCPGCQKKTMRTEEERRKLVNRLKRVEGQIAGSSVCWRTTPTATIS